MKPIHLVRALQAGELANVDNRDVLALGDVFTGYTLANGSLSPVLQTLSERLQGPSSASGFTKAYLGCTEAPSLILAELSLLLEGAFKDIAPAATPFTELGYPAIAAEAIHDGRTGLLLAEPTPLCLAMNWIGFVLGAAEVDAAAGKRQRDEADAFDKWVRCRYETPLVHWSKPLRIFGGSGMGGLTAFVTLWREFLQEHRT